MSYFAVAFVIGLLATGVLKTIAGFAATAAADVKRTASTSFFLDGLLLILGYLFFVEVGTYDARPVVYAFAALSSLPMIGIGIYILRGRIVFPIDRAT